MKKAGELLPPCGIELKWVCGQSLVPKILSKVSALFPVRYNICFTAGRIVPGLETNGMAVSFLPQLLDRVPACEGDDHPVLTRIHYQRLVGAFSSFPGCHFICYQGCPCRA